MALTEAQRRYLEEEEEKRSGLTPAQQAYLDDVDAPPPAPVEDLSAGETTQFLGARALKGLTDATIDLPYNLRQAGEAVGSVLPQSVKDVAGKIPFVYAMDKVMDVAPDVMQGNVKFSEQIPGLSQALEAAQRPEGVERGSTLDAVGTAVEWGAGGLPNALRAGLTKGVSAMLPALLPDAIQGTTAGLGTIVGEWLNGQTGSDIGELIGGIGGMALALRTGRTENLTVAQRQMLKSLRDTFDDPEAALAEIQRRLDSGETGTLSDLARDSGQTMDVEAAVRRTRQGARALDEIGDQRQAQIYEETTAPFDTGTDPRRAQRLAEERVTADTQRADQAAAARMEEVGADYDTRINNVEELADASRDNANIALRQARAAADEADEAARAVDPGRRTDEISTEASRKYKQAETDYKRDVSQPAWDAYDNGPNIDMGELRKTANDYYRNLRPEERQLLNDKYGRRVQQFNNAKDQSPQAVSLYIQKMKDDINKAIQAGENGWEEIKLGELVEALETRLAGDVENGIPALSDEYAAAVAATKRGYDRFGPAFVGDTRSRTALTPETFLSELGTEGDRGAATIRLVQQAQIPELQSDIGDFILRRASQTRNLDESFLNNYEAVFDSLPPQYRAQVVDLIQKRGAADAAETASDAARKAADADNTSAIADIDRLDKAREAELNAVRERQTGLVESLRTDDRGVFSRGGREADALIDDMLTRPEGARRLTDLMLNMDDLGPEAIDGLRAQVGQRLENRLFDIFEATADSTPQAKANALEQFREMRLALTESGIVDEATAQYVDDVLGRAQTEILRKRSTARLGEIVEGDSERNRLFASILASAALGPLPGAYNLQLGGAVRRQFLLLLDSKPNDAKLKAVIRYLSNPDEFLRGLEALDSPAAQGREFLTRLVGAGQAADILAGEE